jgi:hypothetical protein
MVISCSHEPNGLNLSGVAVNVQYSVIQVMGSKTKPPPESLPAFSKTNPVNNPIFILIMEINRGKQKAESALPLVE